MSTTQTQPANAPEEKKENALPTDLISGLLIAMIFPTGILFYFALRAGMIHIDVQLVNTIATIALIALPIGTFLLLGIKNWKVRRAFEQSEKSLKNQ